MRGMTYIHTRFRGHQDGEATRDATGPLRACVSNREANYVQWDPTILASHTGTCTLLTNLLAPAL